MISTPIAAKIMQTKKDTKSLRMNIIEGLTFSLLIEAEMKYN